MKLRDYMLNEDLKTEIEKEMKKKKIMNYSEDPIEDIKVVRDIVYFGKGKRSFTALLTKTGKLKANSITMES
jgi:hypothetical protein